MKMKEKNESSKLVELKSLIENSGSLNEQEKGEILKQISKLNDKEIKIVKEAFQREHKSLEKIEAEKETTLKEIEDFAEKGKAVIDEKFNAEILRLEEQERKGEMERAEKLLNDNDKN